MDIVLKYKWLINNIGSYMPFILHNLKLILPKLQ